MRSFFYILLILIPSCLIAQTKVEGIVLDADTQNPLANVIIVEQNSKNWEITDTDGSFQFNFSSEGSFEFKIQLLGKQEQSLHIDKSTPAQPHIFYLKDKNLRLEEVVVKAEKGKNYSELVLGEEAINQVQAFSLSEVLEQLPSQQITNLSLNEFKPIVFRTVKPSLVSDEGFGNKSFGTAVVVDDIPMSNNANMQNYLPRYNSPFSPGALGFGDKRSRNDFNNSFSNANFGVDLRQITTQDIEKIEVVQGIPSAKYGDLTSGLIKIDQKAGRSPYTIYASLREGTTEYGINKGLSLGEKVGFLNVSASLLNANANPRVSYTDYQRVNTQLMWSWANASKNIRNSLSLKYGFHLDNANYEKEDRDQKLVENEQKDFSISNRFKYKFADSAFLDHLDFNTNLTLGYQHSYETKLVNNGGKVVGFSTEEDVYEGIYTAPTYTTRTEVEGKPIRVYAAADVYKTIAQDNWTHNLSAGASFRLSDNKGEGRIGSPESTATVLSSQTGNGGVAFRPYNYADNVKAETQFSAYVEDELNTYTEHSKFNLTAGLRTDVQNTYATLSPRINTYYIYDKLKIRGGFGLTAKAPSLNQIYTGYRYYDVVLADFRVPGYYNIGAIQTFVEKENNPEVKPSRSLRTELGLDYKLPFGTLNVTGFYNRLYDGITSTPYPIKRELANVSVNDEDLSNPELIIDGTRPYYYTESEITNGYESEDRGLEFFLNLPKLFTQNLDLGIQGSYIETTNKDTGDRYVKSSRGDTPERFGLYNHGTKNYSRFNLGGNLSYHIPQVGLVVAIRSEHIIFNNYEKEASLYPYAYIDENLQKVLIPNEDQNNTALYGHIIKKDSKYTNNNKKVYHNFHLRVSKDFLNGFRFSLYANNFLDLKPTTTGIENGKEVKKINPDVVKLSFGTKIEYQF